MASISAAWILPNPWSSPIPRAPDRLTHHFKGCGKSRIGGGFIGEADGIPDAEVSSSLVPALRGKDYGKTKMRYPDYNETQSGLQYKDLRVGDGPTPKTGDTVVVDWDGYTIGYYGRIFEARNKTKGGSFEGDDKDFFKFKVGSRQVIPAFEEAIVGMAEGGIRRIIVPPDLGYPDSDFNKLGPRPTTFSGQRALDFVLRNQGLIDKTLLFDIELLKIVRN
uniref:peptidylprolyl isomerase n=1 Tax=Musa acuminata subsp. malaccensis TaxID=214687 RepID=A0A804JK59_MUSAM